MGHKEVKWCCAGFKAHYEAAGEQSFAILVDRRDDGKAQFVLQFRALSEGTTLPESDVRICLLADTRIRFCPWCGRKLARWYEKHVDVLSRAGFRINIA
jgi:hypothetical protein